MTAQRVIVLDALDTAVEAAKAAANHKGCVAPAAVISIIDDVCIDLGMTNVEQLPKPFRQLREEAHGRQHHQDVGYRLGDLCERLTMFGPWVAVS